MALAIKNVYEKWGGITSINILIQVSDSDELTTRP